MMGQRRNIRNSARVGARKAQHQAAALRRRPSGRRRFPVSRETEFVIRITSYNVCYTKLLRLLKDIEPFEKQRIEAVKTRLTDNLESLKMNGNIDQNRFEQELIFYLEKLDINEEKVRLNNHCNYFYETAGLKSYNFV